MFFDERPVLKVFETEALPVLQKYTLASQLRFYVLLDLLIRSACGVIIIRGMSTLQ